MIDFLDKYRKQRKYSNIFIIFVSLILALSINLFILDSSNINDQIKTSILDAKNNSKTDIYLKLSDKKDKIEMYTNKKISDIINLNFSLLYDPAWISIKWINCFNNKNINLTSLETGITNVNIDYKDNIFYNISDKVCEFDIIKSNPNTQHLIVDKMFFEDASKKSFEISVASFSF